MATAGLPAPSTPFAESKSSQSGVVSSANTAPPIDIDWDADRLEEAIVAELADDVFTDVPGFLESMFPISDDLLSAVWTEVSKCGGLYDGDQWCEYPVRPPKHEKHLYKPFVDLVDSITRCVPAASRNDAEWRDHHDHTPISPDPCASKIRPDIIATLGEGVPWKSNKLKKDGGGVEVRIPWSRVLVPIEMKKRYYSGRVDGDCPALLQLLKYMRMVFHEAVDRSFVLGIVLAHTNMSVYVADRTGVLGSSTFDIHEEPLAFLRVIVGICTMSPAQLGWDTSMTVIKERERYTAASLRRWQPKLSYQVPFNTKKEDHYWVVSMPKPKGEAEYGVMEEELTEQFVLFKAMNLQRGQVIRGRATRIWKAWRFDDLLLPPEKRQVFILKDSWRDSDRRLEGEFYQRIGRAPGIATMQSYGVVYVDGEADIVASRIRRGLSVHAKPRSINEAQRKLRTQTIPTSTPEKAWGSTTDYAIFADILPLKNVPARTPRSKTHSRLVLETYGWPLKMALSPLEIILAMQDVVMGHRAAFERGVLHRDLSEGNVLITGSKEVGKRAVIIDFDYAKMLEDLTLADDPISGTRPFISGEMLGQFRYYPDYSDEEDDSFADVKSEEKTSSEVAPPTHSVHHDLESLFWILFWLCVCRSGPAVRRTEVFHNPEGVNLVYLNIYHTLFSAAGNYQLATNKALIIKYRMEFETAARAVSSWCRPLKPLLCQFNVILRDRHEARNFPVDDTYRAFMSALQSAEQSVRVFLESKPMLEEWAVAYQAEVARRAADGGDWELPPRSLPEPPVPLEVLGGLPRALAKAGESTTALGGSRKKSPSRRGLESAFGALHLVPRPSSPCSSDSASSEHTTTGGRHSREQRKQSSHASKHVPSPSTEHPAENPSATNRPTTKAVIAKAASKIPRPSAPPTTQYTGVGTRAMKRTALAVATSSRVQTRSQRASQPSGLPVLKNFGTIRETQRTRERRDAVQDADNTDGRRAAPKEVRAPTRRGTGR